MEDLHARPGGRFARAVRIAVGLLACGTACVAAQTPRFLLDSAATRIGFEADATLGTFSGRAARFQGWADIFDTVTFARTAGRVDIDVASFRTGNGMRDGHLRGELQADRFPFVTFVLNEVVLDDDAEAVAAVGLAGRADEPPRSPALLRGELTIRDATRAVEIRALVRAAGDTVLVRGRLPTRFTDFDMRPPRRLLLASVKDEIVLTFDAVFLRERREP